MSKNTTHAGRDFANAIKKFCAASSRLIQFVVYRHRVKDMYRWLGDRSDAEQLVNEWDSQPEDESQPIDKGDLIEDDPEAFHADTFKLLKWYFQQYWNAHDAIKQRYDAIPEDFKSYFCRQTGFGTQETRCHRIFTIRSQVTYIFRIVPEWFEGPDRDMTSICSYLWASGIVSLQGWESDLENMLQELFAYGSAVQTESEAYDAVTPKAEFSDNPQQPSGDDTSAYLPASKIMLGKFTSHTELKRFLDKTPESEIRRRKPSKQRLEIHAGDWHRYWAAQDQARDRLLDDDSMQEHLADVAARAEEERKKRTKSK